MLFSNSEDLFQVPHVFVLYLTAAKSPLGACSVASVMSDSLWPYGLWSVRLLSPCDSLDKNTGVGRPALLQRIFPTKRLTQVSCIDRWVLYHLAAWEALLLAAILLCGNKEEGRKRRWRKLPPSLCWVDCCSFLPLQGPVHSVVHTESSSFCLIRHRVNCHVYWSPKCY